MEVYIVLAAVERDEWQYEAALGVAATPLAALAIAVRYHAFRYPNATDPHITINEHPPGHWGVNMHWDHNGTYWPRVDTYTILAAEVQHS